MKPIYRALVSLLIVLSLDWMTKTWVEQVLIPFQPMPLAGQFFRLTLGYNTGVAFGLFANGGVGPLVLTGIIIVGMVIWLVSTLRSGELPPTAAAPIGLILGGAIANFADRLPDGRVTDFLDAGFGTTRFPTFNAADTFIVLGVALLLLVSLTDKQPVGSGG
ncbi:MAG TPA: signal peptidase II [Anaerolineales bacterium]|jgi:signal peptidase II|nr:signal peptidase II [Anaerolineales bacterium]HNE03191.1 signal peptidase II [Anaerolineales bacterium]HNO92676.1 signal peptidase II [Anaerolineales bacterium]